LERAQMRANTWKGFKERSSMAAATTTMYTLPDNVKAKIQDREGIWSLLTWFPSVPAGKVFVLIAREVETLLP